MHILKPLPGILPMPGRPLADAFALWLMNSLGDRIFDFSCHNNTGTLIAGPIWGSGSYGPKIGFDGIDDYINIVNEASFDFLTTITGPYSIVVRQRNDGDRGQLVSKTYQDGFLAYGSDFRTQADGRLRLFIGDGALPTNNYYNWSTDNVCQGDNLYHDCVVTYNGINDVHFYVDAVEYTNTRGQGVGVGTGGNNALTLKIGIRDGAVAGDKAPFAGDIEFVYIYKRILIASEVVLLNPESSCMFPENIMPEFGISA